MLEKLRDEFRKYFDAIITTQDAPMGLGMSLDFLLVGIFVY